jgi:hypothetical protein
MSIQILTTEKDTESLYQGDIIFIDDVIRENLIAYNKTKADTCDFTIILTQSCDLVKRSELGNKCKAQLLHLGFLSSFDEYFVDNLSKYCENGLFGGKISIIEQGKAQKLQNNLERLFNNNLSDLFFIPEDNGQGLSSHYVVDLRDQCLISFNYYDNLLMNKRCELEEIYRAKLGYMVSQLFSRIGTKDWDKDELNSMLKSMINEKSIILPKEKIKLVKDRESDLSSRYSSVEQLIPAIKQVN